MEEQYRDMFGKPITKKKYEEQTKKMEGLEYNEDTKHQFAIMI